MITSRELRTLQYDTVTLLDGNTRAREVYAAVRDGMLAEDVKIDVVVGGLNDGVVFVAKAMSSLWP